jgi:shikimate kinase
LNNTKIYLIGLPGSGKTTLGKQLAASLQVAFVDLDKEIEKSERKKISEIFSAYGEAYFRNVESRLLKQWAESADVFVMGTGGGAPCFHNGIDIINNTGISIFLDVPIEELVRRLDSKTDRPLLKKENQNELKEKLINLAKGRAPIYRKATYHVVDPTTENLLKIVDVKK